MSRSWRHGAKAQPGSGHDKRTGRRRKARSRLAVEAGRLMYEEGVRHYFDAKRVAARRVFGSQGARRLSGQPHYLPSNGEIRGALLMLAELSEGEARLANLHAMRALALEVMEALPGFHPRLIGSVASGHIRRGSDVDLHVFTDDVDALLFAVEARGWGYDQAEVHVRDGDRILTYTHIYLDLEFPVELSVYPRRDIRRRPRSSTTGQPIDRVSPARLRAIIRREHNTEGAADRVASEGVMLANRDGLVRVRANLDGEVEIRVEVGQFVVPRQLIAVVEGDSQIEQLSVRKTSEVVEILVADGAEVPSGTALMLVREVEED